MSLLTAIQQVARELNLRTPESVVGSSDTQALQLLSHAQREIREQLEKYRWPELQKEGSITLVASQTAYALPGDFDRPINGTHWDGTSMWELIGPVTPQRWELRQRGITQVTPRFEFRVFGIKDAQFQITPSPGSGDAGSLLYFYYQSNQSIKPKQWAASTAFAAGAYCFNDGNIYSTTAGGDTGSTEPTHTSGSTSDGGVNWTYHTSSYDTFLADTDTSALPEHLLEMGVKWRYMQSNGFEEWRDFRADWEEACGRAATKLSGAPLLPLTKRGRPLFISSASIPDTGFGS